MNYKITSDISEVNKEEWSSLIRNHPDGNIFQSYEMYNFFESVEGYTPLIIVCLNDINDICGILVGVIQKEQYWILSYFTARVIIWGGPIIKKTILSEQRIILNLILKQFNNISKTR